jgi:hypothetical protein
MPKTKKYEITYGDGRSLKTNFYHPLSDTECQEIRSKLRTLPEKHKVAISLRKFHLGSNLVINIVNYYVRSLMDKVKIKGWSCTVEEVIDNDDILRHFYAMIKYYSNVYPIDKSIEYNLRMLFRIGGASITSTPANFPTKEVDNIFEVYNINNNYYDFSCGWGNRMLSSLRSNVNYFGTDPNTELVKQLNNLYSDYVIANNNLTRFVDIRCTGSEIFHSEWENMIGLAFSSPPYFDLEDYKIGEQSYKDGINYQQWLANYMIPTIENIKKYLITGGYLIINIKNSKEFNLYDDVYDICCNLGLTYQTKLKLGNIKRPTANQIDIDEYMMVFSKGTPIIKKILTIEDF